MVWQGQYHQYVVGRMSAARLEVPSEMYSVEELKLWVLARRRADLVWRRGKVVPVRERKIEYQGVGIAYLVPGGRWLLVGDLMCGSVTVYDLDARELTGEPLIPDGDLDEQAVDLIAITLDSIEKSPNLAFTMVLSSAAHMEQSPLHVTTWRVALVGDKNNARLVAQRLHSFQAHNHCLINDIALQDNLYARIVCKGDFCYLEVFDLERSSSEAHCKAIIFPGVVIRRIRLLPGNRLLTFSQEQIMIYQFNIADGVNPIAPNISPKITEPTWRYELPDLRACYSALSQGISRGPSIHFLFTTNNHILDLIFHINNDQNPQVVEVAKLTYNKPSPIMSDIGSDKAFIQYPDSTVVHLSLRWEKQALSSPKPEVPVLSRTTPRDYFWNEIQPPKLDEETGRIIQNTNDMIWIIDTALP
ncbi:hypothetical protein BDZ94DRAFT_1263936 [Collybia nuda]|uniref:Uncharacterized protein n=1 Tax=Collybia nuda TaxID=64659 RepID=A0A9P5Y4F4_9AGAR|nr:hypothetical protein BDZ94DRAFT_1263936 [Collybia nuda]